MAFDADMFREKMPALGQEQQAAQMDPRMRQMLMMQALGGQGGGMAQMPQGSPVGAAMTGFANGMRQGGGFGQNPFQMPATDGKRADKPGGIFGWLRQQMG